MSGPAQARRGRARGDPAERAVRPDQQVVLYTAYLDATSEAQAREVGVALCLGKVEGLPSLKRELSRLTLALSSS